MVVDLYGKPQKQKDFGPDSMTQIMSSGKSVASILMTKMYELGVLDFDEKVASYWPEFGQNGKGELKVSDVMRHEAGLHRLHKKIEIEDMWTENIKKNNVGKIIEEDTSIYIAGFDRRYHAISRDLISNEIFRRVEP